MDRFVRAVRSVAWTLFAVAALSSPSVSFAQTADVATTAAIADAVLEPGASSTITLTFHNNGPNAAPLVAAGTLYVGTAGSRTIELFPVAQTPPCLMTFDVLAPPPPTVGYVIVQVTPPGNIPSGVSRSCTFGVVAAPEATGTFRVSFNTIVSGASDPNASNNGSFVDISFGSVALPIPGIGPAGTAVLILLTVLIAAAWRAHESARRSVTPVRPPWSLPRAS